MENCWDYMACPKETRVKCPAYPKNGRDCWKMLSTKCGGGRIELTSIVEKVAFCRNCEFYLQLARPDYKVVVSSNTKASDLTETPQS